MANKNKISRASIALEHINISAKNIEESIDFYKNLFDFKVRWRERIVDLDGIEREAAHVGNDNLYIGFFEAVDKKDLVPNYEKVGVNHFAFVVDDLEHYRDRVKSLKIPIHLEQDYDPGTRFYIYDPNNVEIEFVQY